MTTSAADQRLIGVHAHVERALVAVREAAVRVVELRRRHAEVEQGAADLVDAVVVERLGELVESAMARAHAGSELGQRLGRGVECLGVLVDAEDVDLRVVAQQRGAVPAPAEGRIDDGAGRHHREEFGDLVEHHGTMFESGGVRFVGAHRAPPAISCCPTCSLCR